MPSEKIFVMTHDQLPALGRLAFAEVDGLPIAIANVDGRYYAFSDACRHEGGPLSAGLLTDEVVTCPWHGWAYNVRSGKSVIPPIGLRIPTYPLSIELDGVWIEITWE